MISSAFDGLTVGSALPCQTESLGQGPWYLEAARTRSPRARADVKRSLNMASNASFADAAHPYGRPAMIDPPANVSGYVASITDVMAPPADRPVTNTRLRSTPKSTMARSII